MFLDLLMDPVTPTHVNRLSLETSPYLLQHQHNPVDWFPWSDEAFEKARRENKPIFLSVGYSTCYWCHVMERQSFEVPAVAAVMNELFVNIKVDREERPDVDQLYMMAIQLISPTGWLADERLAHAGPQAVLRRHLLPAERHAGAAPASSASAEPWPTPGPIARPR